MKVEFTLVAMSRAARVEKFFRPRWSTKMLPRVLKPVRYFSRFAAVRNVKVAAEAAAADATALPAAVAPAVTPELLHERSLQVLEELSEVSEKRASELLAELQAVGGGASSGKKQQLDSSLTQFFFDFVGAKSKFQTLTLQSPAKYTSYARYPNLIKSAPDEPYTQQELHLRQLHHAETSAKLGSKVSNDIYFPYKDISNPIDYKDVTVELLLAAGAHLGQAKGSYRSSTQQYITGEYKGVHIIDLDQTVSHLKRAARVVEGVAEKGGLIVFVGTRKDQRRAIEKAAQRTGGYYVSERWIPGTLTNCTEVSKNWERYEVDLADEGTGRELTDGERIGLVRPDLIVVLNPTENRIALNEAAVVRVPTIGIIDTDSEPSLVTYPIPANDDSTRSINFLCGILARAGQTGKERRLLRMKAYKEKMAR